MHEVGEDLRVKVRVMMERALLAMKTGIGDDLLN